ncbi:hypothetical protein NQK81_27805 [Amycolatopsis roodepoortensis]|uniref:hypothetical protein n=1 Tax=Amycolatopsis roodepoortensis TaxID=700274 RepID=UPI00214AF03D|nr:hypothetical protein [Amycolatopsis roodepoortensis]UUV28582.1 hypothetical protein NQK81_27805 [Amycolatopsis roodepoortensis]
MTTTAAATADKPARISKEDRVALAAIDVATALPGKWTVGRGRTRDQVADIVCLATGVSVGFRPVPGPGVWRYRLIPGDFPRELHDVFRWYRRDKLPVATFAVSTSATEVATHIHQRLIPAFQQWLGRAQTALRDRLETQARQYDARRQIATQLEKAFPQAPEPARIYYVADDRMSITLTMPIDDALARIPVLAQALSADSATTAPSTPPETQETT